MKRAPPPHIDPQVLFLAERIATRLLAEAATQEDYADDSDARDLGAHAQLCRLRAQANRLAARAIHYEIELNDTIDLSEEAT